MKTLYLLTFFLTSVFVNVAFSQVNLNIYEDMRTSKLSDWTSQGFGARLGISFESAGNIIYFYRHDIPVNNQKAFQIETVLSASGMSSDGERGVRLWVRFRDDGIGMPPSTVYHVELLLCRQGGAYFIGLYDANGNLRAQLNKDWTTVSPRIRVRIKRQNIGGTDYIFLQSENSDIWDNPSTPNILDGEDSKGVPLSSFPIASGGSEIGFGHVVAGSYRSSWEYIHITTAADAYTVLPYWPPQPPAPTLTLTTAVPPHAVSEESNLPVGAYLVNDTATLKLNTLSGELSGTPIGDPSADPAQHEAIFTGLAGDQTVSGWVEIADVSGRTSISSSAETYLPIVNINIEDILAFFDASIADGTLFGVGPHLNARRAKQANLRRMLVRAGVFIDGNKIDSACSQLARAYSRCDGLPIPPDFVTGVAVSTLADMILSLRASLNCGSLKNELYAGIDVDQSMIKIPLEFSLEQNDPNPFNIETTISYSLPHSSFVLLEIYDLTGRKVTNLVQQEQDAGIYHVQFDGSKFSEGVYIYRLVTNEFSDSKKFIIIK